MESLPPDFLSSLDGAISSLIKQLFSEGKTTNEILNLTGSLLVDKVAGSYKDIAPDFTTPDAEMLARLSRDVWQFSAAKNYQQMRDLTLALKGEDGKLRNFADFETAAKSVCAKYNQTWLRTEYNAAVASSQNAARWTGFKKDAADIPNIEYQTVGDSSVRFEHEQLDGIVRPITDPFWNTHYPPNGWACRCEAIQSVGGKVTKNGDIPNITIPPLFRTNLAETGMIYPKNHPYYNGVPRSEITKAIAWLPPENTYQTVHLSTKIPIDINVLHNHGELVNNLNVVNDLTLAWENKLSNVKLLPDIHEKDIHLKERFLPDGYKLRDIKKNPDSVLVFKDKTEWVVDYKYLTGNGNRLAGHIQDACEKSDYAIIKLANKKVELTISQIDRTVNGKITENTGLKGVIVINDKGSIIYEKFR